jgi:uncharacterized protein
MIYVKPIPSSALSRIGALVLLGAALLLAVSAARSQPGVGQPQRLQAITLTAGMHNIRAEVALTPEQRQMGLMYRADLASHEGMLFVFDDATRQCFWMKNTPTPLTIAFVADDGSIVNLADMKPFDESSHCSSKPVHQARLQARRRPVQALKRHRAGRRCRPARLCEARVPPGQAKFASAKPQFTSEFR